LGGGGQFYSWYLGLGNDYPATGAGSYGMHVAVARGATTPYMSVRYNENNSLGSWIKIASGYADTAGNSSTTSQTNFSTLTLNSSTVKSFGNSSYSTTFTSVSSVTVTHSLGTKDVAVFVYDSSDNMFWPSSIVTTSTSVVTITFSSSRSGRVVVVR
jgi:hypothetical protein